MPAQQGPAPTAAGKADASAPVPTNHRRLLVVVAGVAILGGVVIAAMVTHGGAQTTGLPVSRPSDLVVDAWRENNPEFRVHIEGHVATRFDSMYGDPKYDHTGVPVPLSDTDLNELWNLARAHRFDRIKTHVEDVNGTGYAVELEYGGRLMSYHRDVDKGSGMNVVDADSRADYDAMFDAVVKTYERARERIAKKVATDRKSTRGGAPLAEPAPVGPTTPRTEAAPVIAPAVTAIPLDASSTDLVAKVVELTSDETATVDVPAAASVSTRWTGKGPSWHIDVEFLESTVDIVEWFPCPAAPVSLKDEEAWVRREVTPTGYVMVLWLNDGTYSADICETQQKIRCRVAAPTAALADQAVAICLSTRREHDAAPPAPSAPAGTEEPTASASSTHKPGAGYFFVPSNLTDGDLTTSWQPAKGAHGPHWVRLDFSRDVTITAVDIANGFQVQDRFGDEFTLNSRVATGRMRFSDGSEQAIAFDPDAKGYTTFPVPDVTTNSVTILIDSEHRGTKWHDVAVSEVVVVQRGVDQ